MGKTPEVQNEQVSWDGAVALAKALEAMQEPLRSGLRAAFDRHDRALTDIGGDPLREDWTRFRPLRLSREEDWSDWLAWLLEQSTAGQFAAALFDRDAERSIQPKVDREVSAGTHRLDLLIEWQGESESASVEVKVGDQEFEKTISAAEAHRCLRPQHSCTDWILVPPADRETCAMDGIHIRTWDEVALTLRKIIRTDAESLHWRIWARAFLGAIEQTLLGFPRREEFGRALDVGTLLKHLEESDAR